MKTVTPRPADRLTMAGLSPEPGPIRRRHLLHLAMIASIGGLAAACSQSPAPIGGASEGNATTSTPPTDAPATARGSGPRVLVAYFSRPGENYFNGGRTQLDVGNTQVVATIIADLIAGDLHKIEAADRYPDSYDATVARNVREQEADARPGIGNPLPDIGSYDVVLLGSPIWNVRAPMIMTTFTEALDFTGRTVHPFTTHAMSGLGRTERDYAASCPGAVLGEGFAIRGEQAADASGPVTEWLRRIGLLAG